ncbi:methyl-accepting chemotaxis protein [Paenibacillus sp. MMS18-CY102]|uniref:methyl-accepting chemotaxis protein n=1 Tax=Paenibacillus sp. MMS18-CY102 TaxID=2682849 RepID=UPI0013662252|nr:methyl-accepting chemotaxis protein [Paenibacillus sp. MMS18-CY102]
MNSLQTRIVLVFSIIITISAAVLGFTIVNDAQRLVVRSMGTQAESIAAHAAAAIDSSQFAQLSAEGASDSAAYYKALRTKLNEMKAAYGLKYLYTMGSKEVDGKTQYYYVVDGAPLEQTEDVSALGEVEEEQYAGLIQSFQKQEVTVGELSSDDTYGATVTAYVPIRNSEGAMIGVVGADFDATEVYALMKRNKTTALSIGIGVLIVSLLATLLFAKRLVKPLKRLTVEMARVQQGDLTVRVTAQGKDETGRLAGAFQSMVDDLRGMIIRLSDNAMQLHSASQELSASAEHTQYNAEQITALIRTTEEEGIRQTARSENVLSAIGETDQSVQRIASAATVVAMASHGTASEAAAGGRSVQQAMGQMEAIHRNTASMKDDVEQLSERSDQIRSIMEMIGSIASQTNLLSLNAAIEAARAGEEGRGFAVVAEQVRKLAVQSESSSRIVSELIMDMLVRIERIVDAVHGGSREVEEGLQIVRQAEASFASIMEEISKVSTQMDELSDVSSRMAAGSKAANEASTELAASVQQSAERFAKVALAAEEQSASMRQIFVSSEALGGMANQLTEMIAKFKS